MQDLQTEEAWLGDRRRAGRCKCDLSVQGIQLRSVMGSGLVRAEVGRAVRGAGQESRDARWENNGCAHLAGT